MKGFQKGDLNPAKTPEFREFIRQIHLRKSSWNKGLPKELQPMYKKKQSSKQKMIVSERMKKNNPMLNPEISQKIRILHLGKHYSPKTEFKKGMVSLNKGKKGTIPWNKDLTAKEDVRLTSKFKNKRFEEIHGKIRTDEIKEKMRHAKLGRTYEEIYGETETKRIKNEKSKKMKSHWKDREYKEKNIEAILKGLFKRPTRLEQKFIDFCKKYNLPFLYCGDGSLLIGFKNPDFVESNGKKICVETANKAEKKIFWKMSPSQYETVRQNHFLKYGWKCYVVWEDELKHEDKLFERVKETV